MSFTIKDFVKIGLNEDITLKRREIRVIKNEIKWLENAIKESEKITEKEYKELIKTDETMLKRYEEMKELVEEKSKKEIKRMINDGTLREVLLDEQGKIIETEDSNSEQSQSTADDSIQGGSDVSSLGND